MLLKEKKMSDKVQGHKNFGIMFAQHRTRSEFWSDDLTKWFDRHYAQDGVTLTQERLLEYLSDYVAREMPFMPDRQTKGTALSPHRIKLVELWKNAADETDLDSVINLDFVSILTHCQFFTIPTIDGRVRLSRAETLHQILEGLLDPFTPSNLGEGPGKYVLPLSVLIKTVGLMLGQDFEDSQTLKETFDFIFPDEYFKRNGRLRRLIDGKLTMDVKDPELKAISKALNILTDDQPHFSVESIKAICGI